MRTIKPISFTKAGYDQLQVEKNDLLEKRKDAVEHLKRAREMGDLSENGYYKASRQKLSAIDRRLAELTYLIRYGVIREGSSSDHIAIGAKVTLSQNGEEKHFEIVGAYEADPKMSKISEVSPLGKLLMGKRVGDTVVLDAPAGQVSYTIIALSS